MTTRPCELTVAEAASRLAEGGLSPVELVESCLERIDALEERVQAWALVDREGALAAARRSGEELGRGKRRGPLHGIPVGLKDIFYTAGLRTEAGSRSWAGFVPSYDATAVARLKEAGAIILGKTHTTEFAVVDPAPTRNPWDVAHTPGGSSAGSGAAVAARMCLAALGSQTAGSTLRPAVYNGVVGLKLRHGRISAYGVVVVSWVLDHVGILARTVEDAALVAQTLAGHDPLDPYSLPDPVPDYRAALESQERPPRLGLVREHFFERADEETRRHVEGVVGRLREAGAGVEEVALPPSFVAIPETLWTIVHVECAAYHQEMFAVRKDQYRPKIRGIIEKGLEVPAPQYARALQARLQQRADMEPVALRVDALLTPGAPGAAPRDLTTTGDPGMQIPWSHLGFPAVTLPTGLGQAGLPLGIQLAAPPSAEERLLGVARWCERALGVHLRPPLD